MKPTSIPRLELMSARLLAQVMKSVKEALENQVCVDSTYYWLDSMTALYWVKNRGEWKQFVSHRVNEILKLTKREEWGHCQVKRTRQISTSQARVFIPSRATAKTLVQAGHVTPPNLPKSGRFLISVLYAIKGGVAKYNMSLSCMSEPLEMPKRNK